MERPVEANFKWNDARENYEVIRTFSTRKQKFLLKKKTPQSAPEKKSEIPATVCYASNIPRQNKQTIY